MNSDTDGTGLNLLVAFRVRGKAAPAGSKTAYPVKTGNFTRCIVADACKTLKPWQADVKCAAFTAYELPIHKGPVSVYMVFYQKRPKAHFRKGGELKPDAPLYHVGRPDVLKLARGVEDAMTGVIYKDDAQIIDEKIYKRYADEDHPEGVFVDVFEVKAE